jgi:hypothetical protein
MRSRCAKRLDQRGERRPVEVERAQRVADQEPEPARLLRSKLVVQGAYDLRDPTWCAPRCGLIVAIASREVVGHPARALLVRARDHQQAAVPAEPVLAAELVREPEHAHAVLEVGRDEARLRGQSLGEPEDLRPARPRPLVVPHDDGCVVVARPRLERVVRHHGLLGHGRVWDALHVEDRFRRLRPGWAGIGCEDQAKALQGPGLLDGDVRLHVRSL